MKVYEINDLSDTKVIDILKSSITEDLLANEQQLENYLYSCKDKPANLFYKLENGVYTDSSYFVIVDDDDNYIASSGWYKYNTDTALVMTRMLITLNYRTKYLVAPKLLPLMIEGARDFKHIWITFNEYNKPLYDWFVRNYEGKTPAVGGKWPEIYKRFKPIGKKVVNNVEQYVVELIK